MIETKIIVKPKGNSGTGNSSGASGYGGEYVSEADYAARAGKAKKAESADLAMRANTANTADRAKYADKAGELDEEAEVLQRYIRKDIDDIAQGTVTWEKVQKLLGGLVVGENFSFDKEGNIIAHSISSDGASEENGKGFTILQKDPLTNTYKLCIDEVIAYTVATVGKLFVNGNSRFGGELSSKQFISGFLGGLGWGIYNTPVTNAAGEQENKWTGEFDNVIVRGSLRVFEMIISQLLGENDNRIFTGMMEVDHYDAESGKVYLNTQDGKLYNPFRKNDIVMVQQYNGMPSEENDHYVTKTYELLITDAGCGSLDDGDKRLDWVTFTNFTTTMEGATAESLIKKKDTFVRVDNLSDSQRKGIIQMMTVGANTPYMDIIYGLKTDPSNALKGRLGNLKGIVHPILGELSGFGEFLNNLYAVGDFIIQRTGESVDSKLQMLENMFSSRFSQTSYELTNSDNYLENGQFLEQVRDDDDTIISCWNVDATDESMFWADALGNPFMVNGMLSVSGNRKVSIDKVDGRQVLRLQNCGVKQLNAHIKQPGTHKEYSQPSGSTGKNGLKTTATGSTDVQDKLYISIRIFAKTAGTLTVGFEGCSSVSGKSNTLTAQNIAVPYSGEWTNIPLEGVWNGTGDFAIRYTGDCYIAIASITDKPLSEFSKSVSTQIKQTATNIQLLGENIDNVNGTTTRLGIELDAEKGEIRQYVDKSLYGEKGVLETARSEIKQTANSITSTVEANKKDADGNFKSVRTSIKQNAESITSTAKLVDEHGTSISTIKQDIKNISLAVADNKKDSDAKYSQIDMTVNGITAITSKLHFDESGNVTNISTAGLVTTDSYAGLFAENVKNSQLATKGEVSVKIGEDEAKKLISIATIQADQINLTGHTMAFTGDQITINTNNFKLDKSGNVKVKGEINATSGSIGGFNIGNYSIGSVGNQTAGMGLSNECLKFMNQAYTQGAGYFITCGSYMKTGLWIDSTTSSSNDIGTGILVDITAGTATPSDPISGGKMCTALDLRTSWADQAGSFDRAKAYEGNHAIVIRGGDVIGLRPSYVTVTLDYSLTEYNHTIECSNVHEITLRLPSSPKYGQCYTIIQRGGKVTLSSSSSKISNIRDGSLSNTWYSDTKGQVSWFWYNGGQWIVTYATR